MTSHRKEAWSASITKTYTQKPPPILLQPLTQTPQLHNSTTTAGNNATTSETGPILPKIPGGGSQPSTTTQQTTSTRRPKKTMVPIPAHALAGAPVGSSTYNQITHLYTVYNIGGINHIPMPYHPTLIGKKKGKKRGGGDGQGGGVDTHSSPYGGHPSDSSIPPGSFPYGPMPDSYGAFHPSYTQTLQPGTNLPIPSSADGYETALWYQQHQQQQDSSLPPIAGATNLSHDSHQASTSTLPSQHPVKPVATVPRFRGSKSSKVSATDSYEEKVNDQPVPPTSTHSHPIQITPVQKSAQPDDSEETVVVYDHTQTLPTDDTSQKYQAADAPLFSPSLGHLHSGGEDISGSSGTAAPNMATDDSKELTSSSSTVDLLAGSAAPSSSLDSNPYAWKDELLTFLSNPEHQKRLLRFNLDAPHSSTLTSSRRDPLSADLSPDFDSTGNELIQLHIHDMDQFSQVKDDALIYFKSFESDGRSFPSLSELASATEYAHSEWKRRREAAYQLGQIDVADEEIQQVLDYLKQPTTHLFDFAQNVAVTKRDLIAVLQEVKRGGSTNSNELDEAGHLIDPFPSSLPTQAADRAISHMRSFDTAGRKFTQFSQLLHAIIAAELDATEKNRIRYEIRSYLNSDDCKLFHKPNLTTAPVEVKDADVALLCDHSSNQLAMPPPDPPHATSATAIHIGIPEPLVPYLIQQLEAQSTWCASFDAFLKAIREEKRRTAQLLQDQIERSIGSITAGDQQILTVADPTLHPSLSSIGELPSTALYDDDLLRLFQETGCGLDLKRTFHSLIQDQAKGLAPNKFATVTELIAKLKELHTHWISRRRAVLEYLSSPSCQLFTESTKDIVLYLSDIDRLLFESGAEPQTIRYLEVFDQAHRHFSSFDDLLTSLKQTTAIVAERNRRAKEGLTEFLNKKDSLLLDKAAITPLNLDRLLEAGGPGSSTLHHLEALQRSGIKLPMGELITTVREAQFRAIDTKRMIWSHVHSNASRVLQPLATARRAHLAATAAALLAESKKDASAATRLGKNQRKNTRGIGSKLGGSPSSTNLNVTLADQAMVATTAAEIILSPGDVSVAPVEETTTIQNLTVLNETLLSASGSSTSNEPLLSIAHSAGQTSTDSLTPLSPSTSALSLPTVSPASLPPPFLSNAEVDCIFRDGQCGEETPAFLWKFESEGLSFSSLPPLIQALQEAHLDADSFRSLSRRCVLFFLSSGACQLFRDPIELRRTHLDQLLQAAGGSLPFTLAHLLRINRQVSLELKQFQTFSSLVHEVIQVHRASIEQREEIYQFLSSADCAIWNDRCTNATANGGVVHSTRVVNGVTIAETARPQVTRSGVTRLYIEGLAGPETIIYLRKLQLRARDAAAVSQPTSTIPKDPSVPPPKPIEPFHPFESMVDVISAVRQQHSTLLGQQLRLLRFFNAPAGAPVTVTALDGEEADANLWSGIDSVTGGGYSVYDLVESNGRDLPPLKVKQLEALSEECHVGLSELHQHLVAMAKEQCEKVSQQSTARIGTHVSAHRPYSSVNELQHALATRIENLEAAAKAARAALVNPILQFLQGYKGFLRPNPTAESKKLLPKYDEEDVLHLMNITGAKEETLTMLEEVAASSPNVYTPTKADLIEAVRDQFARLNESRSLIQEHLTSPYCELFLDASQARIPVTWVFPFDIDRLLTETFATNSPPNSGGQELKSKYNYNVLHYLTILETRKVSIGNWNYLIGLLKELDAEWSSHLAWEQKALNELISSNSKRLFTYSNFSLSQIHLNKLLSITDGSATTACFLIKHSFLLPRQEHKPFNGFGDLCQELGAVYQKSLEYQRQCFQFLSNPTNTVLVRQAGSIEIDVSKMNVDGHLTIAPPAIPPTNLFDQHGSLISDRSNDSSTLLSLEAMQRVFIESGAGFDTLNFLQTYATAKRSFNNLYELITAIRFTVDENEDMEQRLYQFFDAEPSAPNSCQLFAYAPESINVSHADCTRLLLQSEAGPKTLQYVSELNGGPVTTFVDGVSLVTTPPEGKHFDDFDSLITAVRTKNTTDLTQQAAYNASLRKNRERMAETLTTNASTLFITPIDIRVGESQSDQLLDTLIAAGSGRAFDHAHWESVALASGGKEEIIEVLNQTGSNLSTPPTNSLPILNLNSSQAVSKSIQLILRLHDSGWHFHSIHDLIPVLRLEFEKNQRLIREVRTWLQSIECQLFDEIEVSPVVAEPVPSSRKISSISSPKPSTSSTASKPLPVTLAHSLSMYEVDHHLFDHGRYYLIGNSPDYVKNDLIRLQSSLLRKSPLVGQESSSDSSSMPTTTFRSLDSLATALSVIHKDRALQAQLQEDEVKEFVLSPTHGLLVSTVREINQNDVRKLIELQPSGKPLLHLQYLSSSHAEFKSVSDLIAAVEICSSGRLRDQKEILTLLTTPEPRNLIFKRLPPQDMTYMHQINLDSIERLMTESGAQRRTLPYLNQLIKQRSDEVLSKSKNLSSSPPTINLGFTTFSSILTTLARCHLDHSSLVSQEIYKIITWLTNPACRLFEPTRLNQPRNEIKFQEEDLEALFLPLPRNSFTHETDSETPNMIPPETASLAILKDLNSQAQRFANLKECILEVHRVHNKNVAIRRSLLQFFDGRYNPNGTLFSSSPLGSISIGEYEVERLWSETGAGALCLKYIYHLEFHGRSFATLDELITEIHELHQQAHEKDEADRANLLSYLREQTRFVPGGFNFDETSVARLLLASQTSPSLTLTYLQYLDDIGAGVFLLDSKTGSRPEDLLGSLEDRVQQLSIDAHAQQRQLFTLLTSPSCHLFSYASHSETPSFNKINDLWTQGNAGLETLPIIESFMVGGIRFETFDKLAEEIRKVMLKVRGKKLELANYINSSECGIFAHLNPRPTFHSSQMQQLLPLIDSTSGELGVGITLEAAHLDTLALLKSLETNPQSRHLYCQRFSSVQELAAVFQPLQQAMVRTYRAIILFLTTPSECHFFASRAYGVPVGLTDIEMLLSIVREVGGLDDLSTCETLQLHLWAFEAAQKRFSDWKELGVALRAAVAIERTTYPVLNDAGQEFSSAFPRMSMNIFQDIYGFEPKQQPFVSTQYDLGVLITQVGQPGVKLDERQADWFKAQLKAKGMVQPIKNEMKVEVAPTAQPKSEILSSSQPIDNDESIPPPVSTPPSSGPIDYSGFKQAVYEFLWSPSCTLFLPGSDLVTSGTIDALFEFVQSSPHPQPTSVMTALQQLQLNQIKFHHTQELINEMETIIKLRPGQTQAM